MTEQLHFHFSLSCIGEGNGNPLQCFCLENPMDGGACWAAVYGVTQSQTRLRRLSSSSSSKESLVGKSKQNKNILFQLSYILPPWNFHYFMFYSNAGTHGFFFKKLTNYFSWLHHMVYRNSPIRDWTQAPEVKVWSLNYWPTREVSHISYCLSLLFSEYS